MCTRTVGEENPFSIASPARVADPRPYQGGQSDAGFPAGFGISLPQGLAVIKRLSSVLAEHELPVRLTVLLQRLHDHFLYLDGQIKELDDRPTG